MDQLRTIVYISRSLIEPYSSDLLDIARVCLRNNPRHATTGFLYFDKLYFVQILEGTESSLNDLCRNLEKDIRHCDMRILRDQPIQERRFDSWDMAFCDGGARFPFFGFEAPISMLENAAKGYSADILRIVDSIMPFPSTPDF